MRYLPHTQEEIQQMLEVIGAANLDALFDSIPESARFTGQLSTPQALAEPQLMQHMSALSSKNQGAFALSFLGAGSYAHHIPPAVDQLLLRSEFYTAYTPYQPEVAQGTLQAIWEFQTIVSELYGLPLANASMYDGASAVAEATQMARRLTKRNVIVVSECVHPDYVAVIRTYLDGQDSAQVLTVPTHADGSRDLEALKATLSQTNEPVAAVVVGYPSFCGAIEDLNALGQAVHDAGALLVSSTTEPYALGVVKAPGDMGVDIATGEGQALASAPGFGGPNVGLFACREDRKYLQQLPGRICGETVDKNGKRGFVLTLSTREQHIRRERATSNICTNQGLMALSLTIRTSMLGRTGFIQTARTCLSKAEYLKSQIDKLDGYTVVGSAPTFNEFRIKVRGGSAAAINTQLMHQTPEIIAGLDLGSVSPTLKDQIQLAVTELHSKQQLDQLVAALDAV